MFVLLMYVCVSGFRGKLFVKWTQTLAGKGRVVPLVFLSVNFGRGRVWLD